MLGSIFSLLRNPPYCFPQWLPQFTFPPTEYEGSLFSTSSPTFVICRLFDDSHSDRCEVIPHCGFDLHFLRLLMSSTFSCYCWPLVCLLWKNVYSDILTILTGFFLLQSCMSYLYILDINTLSDIWCTNIFFHSVGFHFVDCFFCCAVAFQLNVVPFVYFCFPAYDFGVISIKSLPRLISRSLFHGFFQGFYGFRNYI